MSLCIEFSYSARTSLYKGKYVCYLEFNFPPILLDSFVYFLGFVPLLKKSLACNNKYLHSSIIHIP
jgi:hypothetical protein